MNCCIVLSFRATVRAQHCTGWPPKCGMWLWAWAECCSGTDGEATLLHTAWKSYKSDRHCWWCCCWRTLTRLSNFTIPRQVLLFVHNLLAAAVTASWTGRDRGDAPCETWTRSSWVWGSYSCICKKTCIYLVRMFGSPYRTLGSGVHPGHTALRSPEPELQRALRRWEALSHSLSH